MRVRTMWGVAAAALLGGPLSVVAETTARQSFRVQVPTRLAITAPPAAAHAELRPDQTQVQIAPQTWEISANSPAGATVLFSTEQSFHHLDDDSIRRDAQLEVSIIRQSSSVAWSVTQAQAATAHQSGHETATVQVHSTQPGSAVLGLTVTFLQGDAATTPGGDYATTVVGTITEN